MIDTNRAQNFINAAGERLAFLTMGDPANPPVILVHGWTSFIGVWDNTLPLLAETYYVVALDLLGHGRSAKPHDADYSILAQGRRVLALADMLGLTHFALIGHSMGGQIALGMAGALAPERVTRLVVISPVVSSHLTPGARIIHQLYRFGRFINIGAPLIALMRHNPHTAQMLYGRLWFYDLHDLPREVWERQAQHSFDRQAITPIWKSGDAVLTDDRTPDLTNITAPTLLNCGHQDSTVPATEFDILESHLETDATVVRYDDCGHFPMFEQPDAYHHDLTAFLNG